MQLGQFGLWTSFRAVGEENAAAAVSVAERLGYGALWLGGSPHLPDTLPLLQGAGGIAIATGIVNVWQNEPETLARQYDDLRGEYEERLLVGIGIGHPEATSDYRRPLTAMRHFLDGLDAADPPLPRERRCLAALGPKMLELCAQRSLGAHTYFVPVAHTRDARARMGDDALLAVELACVLETDETAARRQAREYARMYLGLRNYTNNLREHGFSESDISDGGSDRLIDEIVPHGTAEQIAATAREHIEAGADHVCLQAVGVAGVPEREWSELSAALGLT